MKKKIILTLLLCAILAACNRGNSSSNGATPASAPAPTAEINYRADLIPLIVGSYSGECSKPPSIEPLVATVLVKADGTVTSTGVSGNLLGKDVGLNFSKQFASNAIPSFSFGGTTIESDTFGLFLKGQNGDSVSGDVQTYSGSSSVVCTHSADTAKLGTKSIFSPIEKYLTAPARDLNCVVNGNKVETVRYQVLNGGAILGGETYSFTTGLKSEAVLVGPLAAVGDLNYLVEMLDGRSLMLVLDKFGSLLMVSTKSGTGAAYSCTPL
jgi:hypothetical protein